MPTVLVALQDPALRDQIRTALRLFKGIREVTVPRDRLLDLLRDPAVADALILEHQPGRDGNDPFISQIRTLSQSIAIVAVGDRPDRAHFNRAKVELDILSFVPLPLDPFELLHRLHRLSESLLAPR